MQIERRVDRLGNLAERTQLLDRASERGGARLHLVEQPHIFDRDNGLVSEGLGQFDLLVGKRPDILSLQDNYPDGFSLPQQWHTEHGTDAASPRGISKSEFRVR